MDINNVMFVISIMANLSVSSVVLTVCALAVGLVAIGSVLVPIASSTMSDLTSNYGDDGATWASMVGLTVLFSILGLVILAVNQYTKK